MSEQLPNNRNENPNPSAADTVKAEEEKKSPWPGRLKLAGITAVIAGIWYNINAQLGNPVGKGVASAIRLAFPPEADADASARTLVDQNLSAVIAGLTNGDAAKEAAYKENLKENFKTLYLGLRDHLKYGETHADLSEPSVIKDIIYPQLERAYKEKPELLRELAEKKYTAGEMIGDNLGLKPVLDAVGLKGPLKDYGHTDEDRATYPQGKMTTPFKAYRDQQPAAQQPAENPAPAPQALLKTGLQESRGIAVGREPSSGRFQS